MTQKRNFGIKRRCIDFYEEYSGEKVYFATFYQRVRLNPRGKMEELIKPKVKGAKKKDVGSFAGTYANEMKRRFNHPEPKPTKQVFYGRIRAGYPIEEAILTGDEWQSIIAKKGIRKFVGYKPTYSRLDTEKKDESYTGIDITLSKEEAQVFRKEYMEVISNLEQELMQLEEKTLIKETNDKLELVKAELSLFELYNK